MRFADIRLVIGTRPEAIKLKPVADALAGRGLTPTLIFTGQHTALEPSEFGLEAFPRIELACPGEENPHAHVQAVTRALLPHLCEAPDLVIVQGDTSSALAGALASFTAGVAVGHVEAGLRTHDPLLPWPEEEYRVAIDAGADLLFAPTEPAAANLRAERVPGEIHITGNTGIDALFDALSRLPVPSHRDRGVPHILVTCHRRESWSDGLRSIAAAITELAHERSMIIDIVLHPNPHVAAKMRSLLAGVAGVRLLDPCGHDDLVGRMRAADLIFSDSGGIQEEAPALGIPLFVLRDKTERPEGIAAGTSRLVGTNETRIVEETRQLLANPAERSAMSRSVLPFGDGRAAGRIAAIVERWLDQGLGSRRLA